MSQDLQRIIVHWTAGGNRASAEDRKHYHMLVEHDGNIVMGTKEIADNIVTSDGDYAAHTRDLNTGSIGISLCGMRGAIEQPFSAGPSPLTERQWRAAAILCAELCRQYSIAVTPFTVLTHAEVEPTLGVKQAGKWDIARLPWTTEIVGARPVGDHFRDLVLEAVGGGIGAPAPALSNPVLRKGDRGKVVLHLQSTLGSLRYFAGRTDGIFGDLTEAAVMAFQKADGLPADGIVGPRTWAMLADAEPRPERNVTEADLTDSRIMTGADKVQTTILGTGAVSILSEASSKASEAAAAVKNATGVLDSAQGLLIAFWPLLLIGGLCFLAWRYASHVKAARLDDARTGATLSR